MIRQHLGRLEVHQPVLALLVVFATVLYAIGSPLVGTSVLAGGDVTNQWDPWAQDGRGFETRTPVGDTIDSQLSTLAYSQTRLFDGDVPLWNPLVGGGSPQLAVPTRSPLHPVSWVSMVTPFDYGPGLAKLVELAIAIGFTAAFLRRLGVDQVAALAGGLIYGFNGFQVVWTNWPHPLVGASVPTFFWAVQRLRDERDGLSFLAVGLSTFFMMAAGFPAVAVHAFFSMALFVSVSVLVDLRHGNARGRLRTNLGWAVPSATAAVAGVAMLAFQLLPFLEQLEEVDRSGRSAFHTVGLPLKAMATAVIPHAFGSANEGRYFGPLNAMEATAYVGVLVGPLLAVAVLSRRRPLAVGARVAFMVTFVVLTGLMVEGTPLQSLTSVIPGFQGSPIGRLRGVWSFTVAVLAAFGLNEVAPIEQGRVSRFGPLVWGAWAAMFAVVAEGGRRLYQSAQGEVGDTGAEASIILAVVLLGLGIAVLALLPSRVTQLGVVVLLSVQALSFVRPFWPRIDPDDHYRTTVAHEYLVETQGTSRAAFNGLTMYPGSTTRWGIRSFTGHDFFSTRWAALITAVDPDAFSRSRTFPMTNLTPIERSTSSVLDRAAVRHVVFSPNDPVFGQRTGEEVSYASPDSTTVEPIEVSIPWTTIRGVQIEFPGTIRLDARLFVEIVDANDDVVGRRMINAPELAGAHEFAAVATDPERAPYRIRIGAEEGAETIAWPPGVLTVRRIAPADDGLDLTFAYHAVIYERQGALEDVRLASQVVVSPNPLEALDDNPASVALVEASLGDEFGSGGSISSIDRTDPDRLQVVVDSSGPELLVVSADLVPDWSATVNGEAVELVAVDHAFAGVPLPGGTSSVELWYEPDSLGRALLVSFVGFLALSTGAGFHSWRHRSRSRRLAVPTLSSDGDCQGVL